MKLHHVVFLLPLLLTSGLTLTLPDTAEIITFPSNGTFVGSGCHCISGKLLTRQRPRHFDCAKAILQLRDNDEHGTFHSDGVLNMFRLPDSRFHGTCMVLVDMKEKDIDDEGSWTQVTNAAGQLNTACVGTAAFSHLHGGFTYTGRTDGVKISLMYRSPQRLEVQRNGTVLSVGGNNTMAGMASLY